MLDLQKANMWKRISAFLCDIILLAMLAVGFSFFMTWAVNYDHYNDSLNACYEKYEEQYGIEFEITEDQYLALGEEGKKQYDAAFEALSKDQEAVYYFNMVINLTLVILSVSILLAYIVLEFIIPIVLKNGRTAGKRVFGLAVIRTDGVKMNNLQLFARTFVGKFAIETMVPVYILVMIYQNSIGIVGPIVLFGLLILNIVCICTSKTTRSTIHDLIAGTVVVDNASQMIFETEGELLAYKQRLAQERAERSPY